MKILSLTSLFPNNVNPVFCVFIKERVRYLAKLHDLRVVAPVPYFPKIHLHRRWHEYSLVKSHEYIAGMKIYHPRYLITPRVGMAFYGLLYFLSILHFMRRLNREYPFDLLDAHYIYPDGLAAVLLAKVLKKPVVLSARGTDINVFTTFPLIRSWIAYALKSCHHIIAVSGALKDRMVRAGIDAHKIDVVPNGVDVERFRPIPKSKAREMLGLHRGETMLLSVGSLRPTKGIQYLLLALAKIKKLQRAPGLKLYIIGDGKYRASLERQIAQLGLQSCVKLTGRIAHEQLYKWYNAADLFCLPSAREGWPNVIMESLACGLPVLATNVGGVPEIVVSQKYGLLVEASEGSRLVDQLQDGILQGLRREWDREGMVAYAHKNTWDKAAQRIDGIFKQTLDGWRRGLGSRDSGDDRHVCGERQPKRETQAPL